MPEELAEMDSEGAPARGGAQPGFATRIQQRRLRFARLTSPDGRRIRATSHRINKRNRLQEQGCYNTNLVTPNTWRRGSPCTHCQNAIFAQQFVENDPSRSCDIE